jgi:hypothetical protein
LRGREHDDRNGGRRCIRLQPPAKRDAIHTRHHPVRYDEVGSVDFGDGLGGFSVERGKHSISFSLQKYPKRAEGFRVIVNEKNGSHGDLG